MTYHTRCKKGSSGEKICKFLEGYKTPQSTLVISMYTKSCCVSTRISHLKAKGIPIKRTSKILNGKLIHFYRIERGR